jgi:hypothetical protein
MLTITDLKEIASELGLGHFANIGLETLREKIRSWCQEHEIPESDPRLRGCLDMPSDGSRIDSKAREEGGMVDSSSEDKTEPLSSGKGFSEEIEKLKNMSFEEADRRHMETEEKSVWKKAMRLVRCQIVCNNPNKTSYQGEIFSARNKFIPEVKKFIPFNVPTHVPTILLNMIREKKLQTFVTEKLPNGMQTKRSKLIPEYSVTILSPLTPEEFNAIRQKQLAEGNN